MKRDSFGEIVLDQSDIFDAVMRGQDPGQWQHVFADTDIDLDLLKSTLPDLTAFATWQRPRDSSISVVDYDQANQRRWFMPDSYHDMDIAQHVLSLCQDEAELQRAGQELLMFQERDLFDLLRWLVYLVDTMRANNVVWGVGRGSSVASFVLYKIGVHRVNSLHYDLDPAQFLR